MRQVSFDQPSRSLCTCLDSAVRPGLSTAKDADPTVARQQLVTDAQALLYRAGYNPENYLTGIFGPLTVEMVENFQRDNGYLDITGRIDTYTWDELLVQC